jgi:uncharacterized protein YaiL (DUF2058 family)
VFLNWSGKLKETAVSPARNKKRLNRKQQKTRPTRSKSRAAAVETEDTEDIEDDNESQDDATESDNAAQELYNLVHDRMVAGMKSEEFLAIAGDLADNFTYVEIKQLYNHAKNRGVDPSDTITVDQYAKLLDRRSSIESE